MNLPSADSGTGGPAPQHGAQRAAFRRDALATRTRLLAAAGRAFARDGLDGASLRRICAAADVNLGAVRYHFGGKFGLYRAVLLTAYQEMLAAERWPDPGAADTPADAFRQWVRFFLRFLVVTRPKHPFLAGLMKAEMARPTAAFQDLADEIFRPMCGSLKGIVAALLRRRRDTAEVQRKAEFTILLCLQYSMARQFIERMDMLLPTGNKAFERFAGQVAEFALAGCRAEGA